MRISHVEIRNFRSIRHLEIDFGETTVFIGPNNAGKTAILDAIRVALPSYEGQKRKNFNEHDIHLAHGKANPRSSDGASITLTGVEQRANVEDIEDIVRLDLTTGLESVKLKTQYVWSGDTNFFEQNRSFLNAEGEELWSSNSSETRIYLSALRKYLPVFYLGALRTVNDEFSSRSSQFLHPLIRMVKISPETESETLEGLDQLNEKVLETDPHLEQIVSTLKGIPKIAIQNQGDGNVRLQALPSNLSEILSKIRIILRNESTSPWLPILSQGDGIQSLSVVFLFQAFVECLLDELYGTGCEPILLLEEPETHLHPHAIRTLWTHIQNLPGQKIITTHSPYFIQHVPFRDIRLVRLSQDGTEVQSLPKSFSTGLPPCDALSEIADKSNGHLHYQDKVGTLTVNGKLDKDTYHAVLTCYGNHDERDSVTKDISDLRKRSSLYVDDDVLRALETHAQRMRGEIFFAKRWLIVEGQSDFLIVHALADIMGYNLDNYGVSVIDTQNNGSAKSFTMLARAFDIPWQAVFDGDREGKKLVRQIKQSGLTDAEVKNQCHTHKSRNLEQQLIADGFSSDLHKVLAELGVPTPENLDDSEILTQLGNKKFAYARILAVNLRDDYTSIADDKLAAFQTAIKNLCENA